MSTNDTPEPSIAAEISELLDLEHELGTRPTRDKLIRYYKHKRNVMRRIAAERDDPDALEASDRAQQELDRLLGGGGA